MATAKSKRTVTSEVPTELVEQLDARGKNEGRARNEVINRAIAFYLQYAEIEPRKDVVDVPKIKAKKGQS